MRSMRLCFCAQEDPSRVYASTRSTAACTSPLTSRAWLPNSFPARPCLSRSSSPSTLERLVSRSQGSSAAGELITPTAVAFSSSTPYRCSRSTHQPHVAVGTHRSRITVGVQLINPTSLFAFNSSTPHRFCAALFRNDARGVDGHRRLRVLVCAGLTLSRFCFLQAGCLCVRRLQVWEGLESGVFGRRGEGHDDGDLLAGVGAK
eukprot:1029770-Rhodomonas_salina.1